MVDQEEARLENSEAILRNLVSEFKAQGIKIKVVDEDSIKYKGVQFDLLNTPTDTLNGVIYLESPSRQVIPIKEENLVEGVESIMQYVESQTENPIGKGKKLSKFDFKFDPISFDRALEEAMASLDDNPDYKRYKEFMERWNNPSGSKPNVVLDADDIRQPIRDWYASTYPDDDLGMNLSDITFHDLHTGISQGLDVYDHIGVGDSIVRERLFDRLAEIKRVTYDDIYNLWLNNARKGVRKSGKGLKKYATNVKKLPNPVLIMCENRTIEVPYQYDPYDSWDRRYTELDMGEFIITISISSSDPFTEVEYHINALNSQTRGGLSGADSYHGRMDIDYAISSGFSEVSDALDHAINGAKLSNIKGGAYWYHDKDNPLLPSGNYWYGDGEWVSKSMRKSSTKKSKKLSKNIDRIRSGTHLGTTVYNPPNLSPQSNYYITDGRFYEVTSEHGVDSILDLTDDVQGGIFVPPVNRYNREFPDDDSIRGHIDSAFNLTKKSKKLSKNMKKYVEGAVPLPDPIILNVNGQRYELKSDSAYIPTSMDFRKAEIRMDDIVIVARVEVKEPYFTYDWSVVAYRNNGWGSKIYEVEPYYGYDTPIEDGIATNFREVSEALDHVIQDYRMQSISGYYPDYNASAKKSAPTFSQMMKSVKDGSFVSKAYLPYDYPPISDGTEQYHVNRKLNGESYYTQHFNTYHTYSLYCESLIEGGWEKGKEYLDYNDAGGISGATVTFYKETD